MLLCMHLCRFVCEKKEGGRGCFATGDLAFPNHPLFIGTKPMVMRGLAWRCVAWRRVTWRGVAWHVVYINLCYINDKHNTSFNLKCIKKMHKTAWSSIPIFLILEIWNVYQKCIWIDISPHLFAETTNYILLKWSYGWRFDRRLSVSPFVTNF